MTDPAFQHITVEVDEAFIAEVDAIGGPEVLRAAIAAVLEAEGRPEGELTLVITDDDTVQALNREYLGEDHPTDVLSFPTEGPVDASAAAAAAHFVSAPEAAAYLGDILIGLPFVRRQAAALGHPLADELRLLAVHGTLHLLGYDHAEPEAEARMWARQEEILHQVAVRG